MTEQQNAQRTRRIADAVTRGDMKTYGQAPGDDVVLHVPGASPLAGDYEGKEGVFGFLGTAAGTTDNTFRFEVFDILASDTRSVALGRATAERDGRRLDTGMVEVRRFGADGLVSEVRVYLEETAALDEFFS